MNRTLRFLEGVRASPHDDDLRTIFADWCLENDWEAMGLWLRFEILARSRTLTEAEATDFANAGDQLLVRHRAVLIRGPVTHCAQPACTASWEDLHQTGDPCYRTCVDCGRPVVFSDTHAAAETSPDHHHVAAMLDPSARRR